MDQQIEQYPPVYGGRGKAYSRAIYKAIIAHKKAHDGNWPTLRELQDTCNISSTSEVSRALARLVADGRLEKDGTSFKVVGGRWALDG